MKLLSLLKKMSLQRLIAVFFICFTLLPSLFITVFAFRIASEQSEARITSQMEQLSMHVNADLNSVIDEAARLMNFTSSYTISQFLTAKTETERYESAKEVGKVFTNIRQTQSATSSILDICTIGINGHCFSERNGYFQLSRPFASYNQFSETALAPRSIHVQGVPEPLRERNWESNILTVSSAVFKIGTNEITGILQVAVSKDSICNILQSAQPSENGHTIVIDRSGMDMFSPDADRPRTFSDDVIERVLRAEQTQGSFRTETNMYVYSVLPSTDWIIISQAPLSEIFHSVYSIRFSMFLMIGLSVLCLLMLNFFLTKYLTRPVLKLEGLMKEASAGNFDIQIPQIDGQTEINNLFQSFDAVIQNTKLLMAHVVEEQKNLKRSELKALQSQINPHFLYNTLDSAIWAAESGQTDEVVDLISALSDFYRLTLRSGMDIVSFSTEIRHAESYLHIMQMRYQDILTYEIESAETIDDARFPKIILQPIIENAIYHGIKNRRYQPGEIGCIRISAEESEPGFITIRVTDNGCGMDEKTLSALRQNVESGILRPGQSYGLINVHMRLKLFFGEQFSFTVNSIPNTGTQVILRVPFIKEESHAV